MKKMLTWAVVLLAVILLPLALGNRYVLHVATMIAIMSGLALSMHLMLRIGQVSMMHAAFMAIGAYASALLTTRLGFSPWAALLAAATVTGLAAGLLGLVILRIKGVFFVLLTYACGQIVNLVLQEWTPLTGGNNGLSGIPQFAWFGHAISSPPAYYLLTVAFAGGAFLVVRAIYGSSSKVGNILNAINQDEDFSRSLGVNALMWRSTIFGISAAIASVAGSLYAHHLNFLSPSTFSFRLSVDLLVMNIVGGATSIVGPIVGAFIVVPLPELLRDAEQYAMLIYGVLLLVCLLFFKDGVTGFIIKLIGKLRHAKT